MEDRSQLQPGIAAYERQDYVLRLRFQARTRDTKVYTNVYLPHAHAQHMPFRRIVRRTVHVPSMSPLPHCLRTACAQARQSGWYFDETLRLSLYAPRNGYYGWHNFSRYDLRFAANETLSVEIVQADWLGVTHDDWRGVQVLMRLVRGTLIAHIYGDWGRAPRQRV